MMSFWLFVTLSRIGTSQARTCLNAILRICPIFLVSNVTGESLGLLRMFLNLLPARRDWTALETAPVEFHIDRYMDCLGFVFLLCVVFVVRVFWGGGSYNLLIRQHIYGCRCWNSSIWDLDLRDYLAESESLPWTGFTWTCWLVILEICTNPSSFRLCASRAFTPIDWLVKAQGYALS